MQRVNINIFHRNISENTGEDFCLTLYGIENETVELNLTEKQIALLDLRFTRSFYIRCKKEKILQEIDDASTCSQLETIASKYYLCDCCDLSDINLYGAKRVLRAVTETLYRYPKLRSKLCFVGTHDALGGRLKKLTEGDLEVLNDFNLQYICTEENAKKLGALIGKMLSALIQIHKDYVATALSAFGLFDAVLLDKNDYNGYAYIRFVSLLRQDEAAGYHPEGCYAPESIVYHEMAHLLDGMCDLANRSEFEQYYKGLTQNEIKRGLSEYALNSPAEFIAEAFAEYMCNPAPRPLAAAVGALLDDVYKKQFK